MNTYAKNSNSALRALSKAVRKAKMSFDAFTKACENIKNTEEKLMHYQLNALGVEKWKCRIMAKCCTRFKTNKQFRLSIVAGVSKDNFDALDLEVLILNTPPELMGDASLLINQLAMNDGLSFSFVFNHLCLPFKGFNVCIECGNDGWIQMQRESGHTVMCDCGHASRYFYRSSVKSCS